MNNSQPKYREITISDEHQRQHFEFFSKMEQPHFNITAEVNLASYIEWAKTKNFHVTSAIVYLLARAANQITEFRRRITNNKVIEYASINPSFTIKPDVSPVFSFCTVTYDPDIYKFMAAAKEQIEIVKKNPVFADDLDRSDYIFMTALPWIRFSGFQHAMHNNPDSVPRMAWGKLHNESNTTFVPLSVQAHHALVDGEHVGLFFQLVENLARAPDDNKQQQ